MVGAENQHFCAVDGNLYNKKKTSLVRYAPGKTESSFSIPDGVTTIGVNAFSQCINLIEILIPNSVTVIGGEAFDGCINLVNIVIPDGVTQISQSAFDNCTGLINIVIPENVTKIVEWAFSGCSSLTSVTIPSSVTHIGRYAFLCKKLTDIIFTGTKDQWNAIQKENGWDSNTPSYTVHCTDGDITK